MQLVSLMSRNSFKMAANVIGSQENISCIRYQAHCSINLVKLHKTRQQQSRNLSSGLAFRKEQTTFMIVDPIQAKINVLLVQRAPSLETSKAWSKELPRPGSRKLPRQRSKRVVLINIMTDGVRMCSSRCLTIN